jgi:hypothetical protein
MSAQTFSPSNPWPSPEADTEEPGRVWRSWLLVVKSQLTPDGLAGFGSDKDVIASSESENRLLVRIRSDDPITCDVHQVMAMTRDVFEKVDQLWGIDTIQGVPKDRWLLMRG